MEKRFFLAFVLILAFFVIWSRLMPQQYTQQVVPEEVRKETSTKTEAKQNKESTLGLTSLEEATEILPQVQIGNFVVTYSPLGGFIKEIKIDSSKEPLSFKNIGFIPEESKVNFSASIRENKITFQREGGPKKEFFFNGYQVELKFTQPVAPLLIFSNYFSSNSLTQRYEEGFYSQKDVLKRSNAKGTKEGIYGGVSFAGARDRYYCISLLKDDYKIKWAKEKYTTKEGEREVEKERVDLFLLSPLSEVSLYIGPQSGQELKRVDLEEILHYGFFHIIGIGMVKLLSFLYFLTKSWGLSVILLTICVYGITFPFTAKSTKALKMMQQIQPEIEALRHQYKDNPQKAQKETMEIYRKYKVNPLGGCLPLLLQLPIFLTLWQVLPRFVGLRGASFLWIKDLSEPDSLFTLPFTLPIMGNNFNLLPILLMVISLLQQKFTTPSTANSQQKSMGLFMAIFFGIIFYNLPAALVLYWFTQSLLTFLYQLRINKIQQA